MQQDVILEGLEGRSALTRAAFGATRLDQVANEFFLRDGLGNGPSVKFQGAVYMAGQFGGWTAIGAEKTASAEDDTSEIHAAADQDTRLLLDTNDNYIGSATSGVSGSDYALQSLETSFHFFFNDAATTEIYTLSLHDARPIWLDQVANEFFLRDGLGNGPSVKFQGAVYMAGQFGGWTAIGAEKTA